MPTNEELYNEAENLFDAGKREEGIKKLEELLAQDDTYALAHSALAVRYGQIQQHDKAVEHARRVVELEPNDPFSYTALSVTCQRAGRIAEAEDALARARTLGGH